MLPATPNYFGYLPMNSLLTSSRPLCPTGWLAICMITAIFAAQTHAQTGQQTAASVYFASRNTVPQTQASRFSTPASQTMSVAPGGKPFQNVSRQPTISPYLSLDLVADDGTALPNYYAFYKPKREQQLAIESQQAEILKLRQRVRSAGSTAELSRNSVRSMPTTGSSSQFMNLGNYYPGLR